MFIPIRFLAESFNLEIRWNANTNMVYLISSEKVLFEDEEIKIGAFTQEGFSKADYIIKKNNYEYYSVITFYHPSSNRGLFYLSYFDLKCWNEVKDDFSIMYEELYRNDESILLHLFVSDIQYDPENIKEKEEYKKLFNTVESICNSIYIFTN